MAAVNAVGNALTGSTGTGQFVGDTSPTIATPVIAQINDANGNETLTLASVASAVNHVGITNAITAGTPTVGAGGDDADVNLGFQAKGTGNYQFYGTATAPAIAFYYEQTTNGSNYISVAAPASIGSTQTVTWKSASSGYPALDTTDSDAWTAWVPTWTGFSAAPSSVVALYKKIGNICFISIEGTPGTSNANTFTITNLPFTSRTGVSQRFSSGRWINNSAAVFGVGLGSIASATTTLTFSLSDSSTGWTTSNAKMFQGSFFYETA